MSRVRLWDVAWGGASPFVAYLLRDGTFPASPGRIDAIAEYCAIAFLCSLFIFQWFRTSAPISRYFSVSDALDLVKACTLVAALSAALAFVFTRLDEAPRSIPVLHFLLLTAGLLGARMASRLLETRREAKDVKIGGRGQHVLLVGATRLAWLFSLMVEELAPGQYQIIAILDERPNMQGRSLNGYPIVGSPAHVDRIVDEYATHGIKIDKAILATERESLSKAAWDNVRRTAEARGIELDLLPERLIPGPFPGSADDLGAISAADTSLIVHRSLDELLNRPFWKIKRVIDFALALAASIVSAPIALAVSALVLVDVGIPVLFWQQRVGRDGVPLHLYKFRTLHALYDRRTMQRREAQEPSAIGQFLRTTRLDELPQLWNILSGEMSLVGPRPLLPVDQPKDASLRLAVRPGLTGWAQICGANLITTEEKNALDEWYIRHASLPLDAIIAVRTVWMFVAGESRDEEAISMALLERTFDKMPLSPDGASPEKSEIPASRGEQIPPVSLRPQPLSPAP